MAFNWGTFNADEIDTDSFQPIPAGWYPAMVVKSEMKTAKSGGEYLKLEWDVLEGQHKGRKVFCNLNLKNDNKQAEQIATRELANICKCIGIIHPRGSEELHNKPMQIKLAIRPETADFPASNDIKGYEPINKTKPLFEEPSKVREPEKVSSDNSKKPWEA